MGLFIRGGTKFVCPNCRRLQQIDRDVSTESLPIKLKCSFSDCTYVLGFNRDDGENPPTFAKIDPINRVQGKWAIELQEASVKEYWNRNLHVGASFADRCTMIAANLAASLQTIHSLKAELSDLADAMTMQIEGEWGMHSAFLRFWNPGRVGNFIKMPFLNLPVPCQDETVAMRTRLIIHPDFFGVPMGIPLRKLAGGFNAQLITPYTQTIFPLESWISALLELKPAVQLQVVGDKIVGRDLFFCWKDIPGTVPEADHSVDAPSIRIGDSLAQQMEARGWLAKASVIPWGIAALEQEGAKVKECYPAAWEYFGLNKATDVPTSHREAWPLFAKHGRLALCYDEQLEAWEFALAAGAWLFGRKIVLLNSHDREEEYRSLYYKVGAEQKSNTNFHWKVIKEPEDLVGIPWDFLDYIILDYDSRLPDECIELLYGYKKRLVVLLRDSVMDITEQNWEASRVMGLVAGVHTWPHLACTRATKDYNENLEQMVVQVLRQWRGRESN